MPWSAYADQQLIIDHTIFANAWILYAFYFSQGGDIPVYQPWSIGPYRKVDLWSELFCYEWQVDNAPLYRTYGPFWLVDIPLYLIDITNISLISINIRDMDDRSCMS